MSNRGVNPAVLTSISLFARLTHEESHSLAAYLQTRHFARGQTIFMQGDPGDGLYLVVAGQVKILLNSPEGKGLVVNLLGPGDFFGELALLDGEPRSADAIAQEDCQLLWLPRADFLRFLEQRPRVAIELLAIMSRRLRHTTQQVQDVAFLDVPTRLARVLLRLAEGQGRNESDGLPIGHRLTQTELAEMAGATRESVNKWLNVYEREGLIRRDRGQITVVRPDLLRRRFA